MRGCSKPKLLRNVSYTSTHAYSVFLLPRANDRLHQGVEFLRAILRPATAERVRVVYLEDALESLLGTAPEMPTRP